VRLGFDHSLVQLENGSMVNLRPGWALKRKRRVISWEG
jgi:hypothetical protein